MRLDTPKRRSYSTRAYPSPSRPRHAIAHHHRLSKPRPLAPPRPRPCHLPIRRVWPSLPYADASRAVPCPANPTTQPLPPLTLPSADKPHHVPPPRSSPHLAETRRPVASPTTRARPSLDAPGRPKPKRLASPGRSSTEQVVPFHPRLDTPTPVRPPQYHSRPHHHRQLRSPLRRSGRPAAPPPRRAAPSPA